MLDILTIIYGFADIRTASQIRQTCRRLAVLTLEPILYIKPNFSTMYEYRVGSKLHRLDGPAWEGIVGNKIWYRRGIRHREYHPQYIRGYYMEYIIENVHHRETGPSILSRKDKSWFLRGQLHRKIGPAYMWGGVCWYTLDRLHRLDGPACDKTYAIRGVEHSISNLTDRIWRVNGIIIRR